jgi:DNA-binding LacI/PurR family transcriptional regulator/DNA-binding transcriptional regulator YhcF (GntR family)
MQQASFLSITEQVVEHLRSGIASGRWSQTLPGRNQLAKELGVNPKTVEAAMQTLEQSGMILSQGAGRKRLINPKLSHSPRAMRIAILTFDHTTDRNIDYMVECFHSLIEAGHSPYYTARSLTDLRFDIGKIARMVEENTADAWIILGGTRDVLQWFAGRAKPCFAIFGEHIGLPMASFGPNKAPAFSAATKTLLDFGHQRIVLLCRRARRQPTVNRSVGTFVEEMQQARIPCGDYNLPDWEENNAGFQRCLESLFRLTPPTAIIVDEASYLIATFQFLLRRGITVPGDVSLVCTDDDPSFANCEPPIALMSWETEPLKRRILQWANNISRGKTDHRSITTPATFINGGTIGPAKTAGR